MPGDIGSADEGEHCEFTQDVILRLETLTVRETKVSPATYLEPYGMLCWFPAPCLYHGATQHEHT